MDDGMQGRNAKPENGQAAETRAEVNFRVLTVHTPGIETYTLPIPESGQQAGLVTGMKSVDGPASLTCLQ